MSDNQKAVAYYRRGLAHAGKKAVDDTFEGRRAVDDALADLQTALRLAPEGCRDQQAVGLHLENAVDD